MVFEEAARDHAVHGAKKRRTLAGKLEHQTRIFWRVQDLIKEVEAANRSLQRQAGKARRSTGSRGVGSTRHAIGAASVRCVLQARFRDRQEIPGEDQRSRRRFALRAFCAARTKCINCASNCELEQELHTAQQHAMS